MRALYNPRPALNETLSLTDPMKDIRWEPSIDITQATSKFVYDIYQCFRKSGPPYEGVLRADNGNGKKYNHAPIIKKATSLISNTDLRKGMQGFMERNYDASRYYATCRNELKIRARMLAPSNDNG